MKILDKYILRRFLIAFVYVVLLLVVVICIIDLTERLEDYLSEGLSFGTVFMNYYLNFIPYLANMLSPITVFIATVFVTARMASHTEIIAMLSSGMSLRRILYPYLIGSSLIAILTFILIGWIIPKANEARLNFERTYLEKGYFYEGRNVHIKIAPETYAYLETYNSDANTGHMFTLETLRQGALVYKLHTNLIVWDSVRKFWLTDNYSEREYEGKNEKYFRMGKKKELKINLSPKDFANTEGIYSTLTLPELRRKIVELKEKGAENITTYLTDLYERYTYPFAIIILTVIGVIVSSRKSREGTGFQVALGFLLAFLYIIMVIISRNFASIGDIGPLAAAWIPNILFSGIGFVMYRRVPK